LILINLANEIGYKIILSHLIEIKQLERTYWKCHKK